MTTSYDLFNVVPTLQVQSVEVTEAEQMVVQLLQAAYPTLDLRDGAALRDLLVRPKGAQLALLRKAIQQYDSDRMLSNATDATDTAVVDGILSNFFVSRNEGEYARAKVRLRFQANMPQVGISSVYISTSASFSLDNINTFSPISAQSVSVADMGYNSVDGYYFVDIDCQSSGQGADFNIAAGSEFLYFSLINNYFIGATALYLTNESVEQETNTHFIDRAPSAISTRNLINIPSIDYNIRNLFNFVSYQYTAGYTDYEMMRDYCVVQSLTTPFTIHRGGKVDIYARTTLKLKTVMLPCDLSYQFSKVTGVAPVVLMTPSVMNAIPDYAPKENMDGTAAVLDGLTRIDVSDPGVATLSYLDENYLSGQFFEKRYGTCSLQQIQPALTYPLGQPPALGTEGGYAIVDVLYWDGLDSVQAYLADLQSRVVCADQICRGFPVLGISIKFHMAIQDPGTGDALADAIETALEAHYASLTPGAPLYPSVLLSEAVKAVGDAAAFTNVMDLQLWLFDGDTTQSNVYLETFLAASSPLSAGDIAGLMGRDETLYANKVRDTVVFSTMPHAVNPGSGARIPLLLESLRPAGNVDTLLPSGVSFAWLP